MATISLVAPIVSFLVSVSVKPTNPLGLAVLGLFTALLLVVGLILGIIALVLIKWYGPEGILGKALAGTLISGLFIVLLIIFIPKQPSRHGYAHKDEGVIIISPENNPATARPVVDPVVTTPAAVMPAVTGVFIPAASRVDMVDDPKRNLLYISSGDSVLRYQISSKTFLKPLQLGGDLRGMDLAPDNDLLAVADAAGTHGQIRVHLVDLPSESDSPVDFTATPQESGTYSVAFGADGQLWISSSAHGSSSLPARKYDPHAGTLVVLEDVFPDTMLAASADRQSIAFAQGGSSLGPYGRIPFSATQLPPTVMHANSSLYEVAVSRDGNQIAVPGYQNVILAGSTTSKLDEGRVLAAAFHPARNILFIAQAGTSLLSAYDMSSFTRIKQLDFGDVFEWSGHAYQAGRLRFSPDGKYIFCTVDGGVRYAETGF